MRGFAPHRIHGLKMLNRSGAYPFRVWNQYLSCKKLEPERPNIFKKNPNLHTPKIKQAISKNRQYFDDSTKDPTGNNNNLCNCLI